MLVVIGPEWASVAGPTGPRIKEADDYVRIEVAKALARKDVRVIPVLVGGAVLPTDQDLPPDLLGLIRRQHIELSASRWDFDVDRLGKSLDPSQRVAMLTGKAPRVLAAAALAGVVALGGYWFSGSARSAPSGSRPTDLESAPDPLLAEEERNVKLAEFAARKERAAAEQSEDEARKAKADADVRAAKAQVVAAETKKAAEQAIATSSSPDVSEADRTQAAAEAAALARRSDDAQREATARAAEAVAARLTADQAAADAKLKTQQLEDAIAAVERQSALAWAAGWFMSKLREDLGSLERLFALAAGVVSGSSATTLTLTNWVLNSGGCGAGPLTVTGTATFAITTTPEGVVVTEDFRGTGGGFTVTVTGRSTFDKPQNRYNIPTSGQWRGSKVFTTSGADVVTSSDGKTPRTASVVTIRSNCG